MNYQQDTIPSIVEVNKHQSFEKISETAKDARVSSTSSNVAMNSDLTITNGQYQRIHSHDDNRTTELTSIERRERLLTLCVIAFISFLTGNQ
jgi:hypothetical protein